MTDRRYFFVLAAILAVILLASSGGVRFGITIDSRPSDEQVVQPVQPVEPVEPPVEKSEREVLFFTSEGCPPCEAAKPKVRAIRRQGVTVTELDYHENPELVRKYGVTHTPTFIVLEDGVEVERTSSISTLVLILVRLLAIVLPLLIG